MHSKQGFTMVEMVIAISVAAILLGIVTQAFGEVQNRFAAQQGLRLFEAMHARARAHAVEGGVNTQLWVDTPGDSIWLVRGGQTLEVVRFDDELGVEITGSPNYFRLCMGPRGFADTDCTSFSSPASLTFAQGANERSVEILPLGQLIYP
ncbi:MAG: prepilin-type N-terminal cleavage/methylation domain-containing protein [Gemmatimonadota bacterium]|jgi:prepilin-type N-terminal cleavage/methylation domain-containing protein